MADTITEATGRGSKFKRMGEDTSYAAIAGVVSITPPQLQRDMIEVEELSPSDGYKRKLVGLIDGGDVTITLNFDPAATGHDDLEGDFDDGEQHAYQIAFPNGETCSFEGVVTQFAVQEIATSEVIQIAATIAVSTKPLFA